MPKSVPHEIGPAGLILAEILPKLVSRTTFANKIILARSILAVKIGPLSANFGPPVKMYVCNNIAIAN